MNARNCQLTTTVDVCHTQLFILTSTVALGYLSFHICESMLKAIYRDRNQMFPKKGNHKLKLKYMILLNAKSWHFPFTCRTECGSLYSLLISPRCSTRSSFILQFMTIRALHNLFRGNREHPVQACPDLFHTASCAC